MDEASKRIYVVTACSMNRTRKVLRSLLVGTDRTAVENRPGRQARRFASHPASSFVVTVQGTGQTYVELVRTVKLTVNIEQEGKKTSQPEDRTMTP